MEDRTCAALLTLAENASDSGAQAALYDENKVAIEAAIEDWLKSPQFQYAAKSVVLRIARRACYYDPCEDAKSWIVICADLECRRLKDEIERDSPDHN